MKRAVISEASLASLPALNRLFARAVDEHFSYFDVPIRSKVKSDHAIARLLKARVDRRRVLLIARSRGKVVGYAIGAAPKLGPAQLYWLYVEPSHRSTGIGRALLGQMIIALTNRGASTIALATYDHRDFYLKHGFKFVKRTTIDGVTMDIMSYAAKS